MFFEQDTADSGEESGTVRDVLPRFLVVDDDEIDRMQVTRLLKEIFGDDLALDYATTWDEAVAAISQNAHDICIIDHHLGSGTGLKIVEDAGAMDSDSDRIFILLTGSEDRDVDVEATRAGVADYLIKGELTASRLERCLRYAMASATQRRLLKEQAAELEQAKVAIEAEMKRHIAVAEDLQRTKTELIATVARAELSERRHRWLGRHDQLTQIPNRLLFTEKIEDGLEQAKRTGKRMALFLLDIDRFKWVNDTFGHQTGDGLLLQVAERLCVVVRKSDFVARLGGDEFAIIATNLEKEDMAAIVAEKIVTTLSETFEINGHRIDTGVSVGIAVTTKERIGTEKLINNADAALYRAKSAGRGGYRFYDKALNEEVQRAHILRREIPRAIEDDEFSLVFQPIFNIASEALCGVESLARWHHPALGHVSPGEFILEAERGGDIIPLSAALLEQAVRTLAEWKTTVLANTPVTVNVSAVVLKEGDLIETTKELLSRHGVAPRLLGFEVTETAALENLECAVAQLEELRSLGVAVSIDDFGTGYSSLAIATALPADVLKIDLSFVAGMLQRSADAVAVKSSIALAHSLGIRAVAEGVETEQQLNALRLLGCDEAQGFLLARPMPARDLLAWEEQRQAARNVRGVAAGE